MSLDPFKADYGPSLNALGLDPASDPFPIESPGTVDYWADNQKLLSDLLRVQAESFMFTSTRMYIFWGPLGVGKTFAIQYFSNKEVRKKILQHLSQVKKQSDYLTVSLTAVAPKRTGDLTFTLYRTLVERLLSSVVESVELLRSIRDAASKIEVVGVSRAFTDMTGSIVRSLTGEVAKSRIYDSEGYKFLVMEKSKLGKIKDQGEMVAALKVLVETLLHRYQRVVVAIDEMENLRTGTLTERYVFSDFIRKVHDEIDNGLSLFLVFTFDTFSIVEEQLQPAVLSRAGPPIEFPLVSKKSELVDYIKDCVKYRGKIADSYTVISEEATNAIADDLLASTGKQLSFRQVNREMHRILSSAYVVNGKSGKFSLSLELYRRIKKEPAALDDLLKDLRGP